MRTCDFCKKAKSVATTDDGRIGTCAACAAPGGPVSRLMSDAGNGGTPMTPDAEMSLLAAAKLARATAKRNGRRMRPAELSLSLAATAVEQRRQDAAAAGGRQPQRLVGQAAIKEAARKAVEKLGLGGRK